MWTGYYYVVGINLSSSQLVTDEIESEHKNKINIFAFIPEGKLIVSRINLSS